MKLEVEVEVEAEEEREGRREKREARIKALEEEMDGGNTESTVNFLLEVRSRSNLELL